ncbi:DUF3857 domain-containing protein [Desertivirga brevis]|uniref:DUF3857 domain-containing protein n=1 Tax=Desertivirga brevis TaxID=2810310 RepID=UPI001A976680|nr:DUF3857 domain-containing protein [Pedobacter sp. SYSU D00873]
MRKLITSFALLSIPLLTFSQNLIQPFGKVDQADVDLKECSFEKDAHAMVLFDKGDVYFDFQFDIVMERHKRMKIFDDKARDEANVRIEYDSYNNYEQVYEISAQTINYVNGKPVITKLDKKQIFREPIDKYRTAVVFTFPNVQPGSIIEYKYTWKTPAFSNFPTWYFQTDLPVRYSELITAIPDILYYKTQYRTFTPAAKNKNSAESKSLGESAYTVNIKDFALQNIPSLSDEPYMTSRFDNLQCAQFQLTEIRPIGGFTQRGTDTWDKVAKQLIEDEDFGLQFKKKLEGEDALVTKANTFKTDDQKIAYLFNEVRNSMKWNSVDRWYTSDGISKAWQKKTGNSTEINLILCRLLKQAGLKDVYATLVSTRPHGKVNVYYPWLRQFNRTVVTIPIDSTHKYVLDATNKYQTYNACPNTLLNSYGVALDKDNKTYKFVDLVTSDPVRRNIYVNAEVKPDGKMSGSAVLTAFSYHKINEVEAFKVDGEEKYKEWLTQKDNSLKIKAFKMADADVDSLPLQENIDFDLELTGADDNYIYFNPNLFTNFRKNPFLSENRSTSIDFGYNNKYTITGMFKIPAGYKVDALPGSINFVMPDKSISFQRIVAEAEGSVNVRFVIDFKKSIFGVEEYQDLRQFYKQVFDMLNEQIVLKKS